MGYKNLDSLYEEKHRWIRHKNSLDMPENSLNISIWDIYQDIYKMADSLPEQVQCDNYDMRKAMPLETVSVECIRTSNRYLFLKKIESKFRGLTLYNEHIRPWLKQKLSRNFDGGTVDGRKLLAYQGTEFVQVVYRSILGREAEEEALHNANVALRRPGVHRLDILFDINPRLIGMTIRGIEVYSIEDLEEYIQKNQIEIAALTLPKLKAEAMAERLVQYGIKAIWNFAHTDLSVSKKVVVENVHLSESLMRLSYRMDHPVKKKN